MIEPEDSELIKRAQGLSDSIPLAEAFQDIADEIEDWWTEGVPESEIDRRINAWMKEAGLDPRAYMNTLPAVSHLTEEQKDQLLKALRVEEWQRECAKAVARSGRPLPLIYAIGDVFRDDKMLADEGEVLIWAVATRATNPETVARKFVRTCKQEFGEQVTKEQNPRKKWPGQLSPTETLAMHRQGMSYRDIAIQNLRRAYPRVVKEPHKFKALIATERARVVDEIRAAQELWDKRIGDSPTPE